VNPPRATPTKCAKNKQTSRKQRQAKGEKRGREEEEKLGRKRGGGGEQKLSPSRRRSLLGEETLAERKGETD
jgi:hypothetical protein